MTDPSAANLNRAKLHQLLAAVGSAPAQDEPTPEAVLYDWRDPHYFNEDQCNRLAAVMSQVSALLAERCAHYFNSEFKVVPTSITQHSAGDLSQHFDPKRGFSQAFGPEAKPACGFLGVGAEIAMDWVTRLLGDTEAEQDTERMLSSLEESLLSDLIGALVEAFLTVLKPHHELRPSGEVSRGSVDVAFEPTDPICRIVFQISQAEGDDSAASEVTFVLAGPILAPVVGKSLQPLPTIPPDELSRLLMEHVHQMPVSVTARLASTRLSFEEVLDLASGDVLLIDKPLDEPVELIINNQTVFRGRPAQSTGQYAVFITERATDSDAHRDAN
jgi:flagellar motor switch protein FliM